MLRRNLERNPGATALIEGDRRCSYGEFVDRAYRMGNALLALGLKKGDRVAILSRNSIENAESYFSIPCAGLVLVMINFRLAPPEVLTIMEDSQASVLMVHEEYVGLVEEIRIALNLVDHFVFIGDKAKTPGGWLHYETMIDQAASGEPDADVTEDDLAALMYTSGTTGAPKGCMATHRNYYHTGRSLNLALGTRRGDVGIVATPLFHATGHSVLMNGVFGGVPTVIMSRWDVEEFMKLVEEHKVSLGMLATPMLQFLVDHPKLGEHNMKSLRKVLFAGAPVTPVVFEKAIGLLGNVFVHPFGTTETVGTVTMLDTEDVADALAGGDRELLGSCGRSFIDMEAAVTDETGALAKPDVVGELKVRGLGNTLGYWNNDRETKKAFKDGWFHTGDLCRMDERGFFYVVGRKKDMIITGGENVYPAEIENVLYKHPAVEQAAIIGLPDKKWGEVVTAIIVKKAGSRVTEEELRGFCRGEIAGYKVPKKVFFIDSLPMSASGKLLKNKLKEQLARMLEREGVGCGVA
jgi:acyl-CoA synthetase (AMP-forming)/AMP-acid ligase II